MKNFKIGVQLKLAFSIVLLIPLTVATCYSILYYSQKIEEEAISKVSSDIKVANLVYETKIDEVRRLAESFSEQKSLRLMADLRLYDRLGETLAGGIPAGSGYLVSVVDSDRRTVAWSSPGKFGSTRYYENEFVDPAFGGGILSGTELLSKNSISASDSAGERDSRFLSITASAPLRSLDDDKNITGVILVRRILNGDENLINEINHLLSAEVALFDQTGKAIAARSAGSLNVELPSEVREKVIGEGTTFEETDISDQGRLAKYQPITNLYGRPIGIMMVRASGKNFAATRFTAIVNLSLIAVIGFIIAFLAGVILNRQLVGGFETLKESTRLIAQGDYGHPLSFDRKDEIGDLARSFDSMRRNLRDSFARIEAQNTKLSEYSAELQELNQGLETRVERRTAQLEESHRQLEKQHNELIQAQRQLVEAEKMASLGGLVAGVAHEINTPIGIGVTAVSHLTRKTRDFTELIESKKMTRSSLQRFVEDTREAGKLIFGNLRRASDLIQNFKMVAVDQTSEQSRVYVFKAYLEKIIGSLKPELKKNRIKISIEGPENLKQDGYPGVLSQIVTNLVMNALLHAFEGDKEGLITMKFYKEGERFMFIFSDNGKGMDEETRRKIFEPFFTTKRNKGGTGLGMHIIFNLVTQKMGGELWVESELGVGSSFYVSLPIKQVS